jgi:hypothetical protein
MRATTGPYRPNSSVSPRLVMGEGASQRERLSERSFLCTAGETLRGVQVSAQATVGCHPTVARQRMPTVEQRAAQ